MKEYNIIQEFFTKNDCYAAQKYITPCGIMVHSVGCKGTTFNRWRKWNCSHAAGETTRSVCVHGFVDRDGIYETLPWNMRGWHAGKGVNGSANDTHISFEICEPLTKDDTSDAALDLYEKVLFLCVFLCKKFGLHYSDIICHCEGHALGIASNHADVNHWWGRKGTSWEPYTMNRLRKDVAAEMGEFYMQVIRNGSKGDDVSQLQTYLNSIGFNCGDVDGKCGKKTVAQIIAFQQANGLTADGIVGALTWAALGILGAQTGDTGADKETPAETVNPVTRDEFDALAGVVNALRAEMDALKGAAE